MSEFGRRLRETGPRGTDHGTDRGDPIPSLSPPELDRQELQVARV